MKITKLSLYVALLLGFGFIIKQSEKPPTTLKDAFDGKFYIGAALNSNQINKRDEPSMEVLKNHFNSIVAENVMKSGMIQVREGEFNFSEADKFVELGLKYNFHIIGHTLIWHSQAPSWFFTDKDGNDVSPEELAKRMETHIKTVVGRYKGKVDGWDVVNEAIMDDGSWRESKFYKILGEDFIKLAFQYTHEADPDAALYYNDYSMANPGKREGVVKMVKGLQAQGIKIDGIGMQGHVGLSHPAIEEFEKSILAFADLGVTVMITELDMSVLPSPRRDMGAEVSTNIEYQQSLNPYTEGLPDAVQEESNARYLEFFKLFLDHHDKISRVTFWGINDGHSWKNGWPVRGRTDYPLLFNRNNTPKSVVSDIIQLAAVY